LGVLIKGKAGFGALIDAICDKGISGKTLVESDLEMMGGEGYCNLQGCGTVETGHALIVKKRFE
jgi:hypothetical protein